MATDISLTETSKALANMAAVLVAAAQANLQASGHVASGALAQSIQATAVQQADGVISFNIQALPYYKYLNKGVRGTQGGSGDYTFAKDFPGAVMLTSVQQWAGARSIILQPRATVHNRSPKNNSISSLSAAFAISRSILRHGIPPTGFMDKAVETAKQQCTAQLQQACKTDIINTMQNNVQ